jgi:phage repressor protein C with HTH and peptisase S24 domain
MLMKYADRLRTARKNKKLSQEDLAQISGVTQSTISKIERGDQDSSTYDTDLARALDIHPFWLSDEDYKYAPAWLSHDNKTKEAPKEYNAHPGPKLNKSKKIPIVGIAQLGDNGFWAPLDYPPGHGDGFIEYWITDDNAYAIRCVGDSMRPRIKNGEFVIVAPNHTPIPGDEILLKSKDGRVMVKTLLYTRSGYVFVMSINEQYPPQSFALAEIDTMHAVIAIAKTASWEK